MKNLLFLAFLVLLALPAYAHEGHVHVVSEVNAQVTPSAIPVPAVASPTPGDEFAEEGLSDLDLEADSEAETLPQDGILFGLENAWFRIRRAFTLQAERKAELDRERLHRLDRKLTACAELGDEECVTRIESMIGKTEERAQAYLERKEEIQERFQERFEAWRERRGERVEELKDVVEERKSQRDELIEKRQETLDDIRSRRKEFNDQRKEQLEELRKEQQALREDTQQLREQVIEQRSERVKKELDTTRANVNRHKTDTQEVIRTTD